MRDVFEWIDSQNRSFYGFNPFGILSNVNNWRKYFGFCVIVASLCWICFGFDSTWSMLKPFGENWLQLLRGEVSFSTLCIMSREYYGMGNHFSAPVIYGISFVVLSLHLEKVGIKDSLNFCVTTGMSLMSIGTFELMWNSFFAIFHGQTWVITFQWKQITNLCAFIAFCLIGFLCLLYVCTGGYKPNVTKISISLLVLTIASWVFWINYPFPVGHIIVDTTTGPWTNSDKFPQTYYCVDIDPTDSIAIGEPNWVENDLIHFVNTGTKVVQTIAILSVCMVRNIKVTPSGSLM